MKEQTVIDIFEAKSFKHIWSEKKQDSVLLSFRLFCIDGIYYNVDRWLSEFAEDTEQSLQAKLDEIIIDCYRRQTYKRIEQGWAPKSVEEAKTHFDWSWSIRIRHLWETMGWPKFTQYKLEFLYRKRKWFVTKEEMIEYEKDGWDRKSTVCKDS